MAYATHWDRLSDKQMVQKIRSERTPMTPEQVTDDYLRGMRHYESIYPHYGRPLLSFMVRIDMRNGLEVCSCAGH